MVAFADPLVAWRITSERDTLAAVELVSTFHGSEAADLVHRTQGEGLLIGLAEALGGHR